MRFVWLFSLTDLIIHLVQNQVMLEDKKDAWFTYMAIATILIAVTATLSAFKGDGDRTISLPSKTTASFETQSHECKQHSEKFGVAVIFHQI